MDSQSRVHCPSWVWCQDRKDTVLSAASPDLPPPPALAGCKPLWWGRPAAVWHPAASYILLSSHGLVALGMCGSLETRCFSPKFNCQVVFKSTWHWNNKAKEYLATFMDFFKCLIWIKAVWLVPTAVQPGDRVSQCPAPWESRPYTVNEEAESCDCQDVRGVL